MWVNKKLGMAAFALLPSLARKRTFSSFHSLCSAVKLFVLLHLHFSKPRQEKSVENSEKRSAERNIRAKGKNFPKKFSRCRSRREKQNKNLFKKRFLSLDWEKLPCGSFLPFAPLLRSPCLAAAEFLAFHHPGVAREVTEGA